MTDIKPSPIITDLPSPAPSDPLEALSWLGDSVEEIAEGLRARGIKGRPRIANACPLAIYLSEWFPNPSIFAEVSAMSDNWDGYSFHAKTPNSSWDFIHEFDSGGFPDLIDNG